MLSCARQALFDGNLVRTGAVTRKTSSWEEQISCWPFVCVYLGGEAFHQSGMDWTQQTMTTAKQSDVYLAQFIKSMARGTFWIIGVSEALPLILHLFVIRNTAQPWSLICSCTDSICLDLFHFRFINIHIYALYFGTYQKRTMYSNMQG